MTDDQALEETWDPVSMNECDADPRLVSQIRVVLHQTGAKIYGSRTDYT